MRQSQLFTKTSKEAPKDETSINARILIRAGFIDKVAAGIYTFLPLGLRVHNKIINIIREEMNAINGQEIFMPALTPKEVWEKTNRWDNFDALFKLKGGDEKEYALGATHEEIVTPLAKKHIFSYKDLPIFIYQIQTKFRNELRARAGLVRGREFSMKDLYSFHTSEDDLNEYYKVAQKAYFKVFERCGLLSLTYLTFASGGAFSKYSHEFQAVVETGEDIIHICKDCNVAVNKEIINEQKVCPSCGNKKLEEKKAIEIGNIFKLGTRFSKPVGLEFTNEKGEKKDVIMGCYGIGPSRLMGTVAEICHDDKGIIWPEEISPFKAHLLEIKSKKPEAKSAAEKIYANLENKGIEILYDDREAGAGEKFADADLIGCPYRIVISEKTLEKDCVEVKKRNSEKAELVKISELVKQLIG
jgi:prolyl-tRNA synthetase